MWYSHISFSPATIQSAAAALSSLAALSLSGSPPPPSLQPSTSFTAASDMIRSHSAEGVSGQNETSVKQEDTQDTPVGKGELSVGGITIKNGTGKKRGTIFKCESCSKVCVSLSLCDVPSIDTWPHRSTAIRLVSLSTVSPSSPLLASPPHRPISHSHRLGTFPALAGSF